MRTRWLVLLVVLVLAVEVGIGVVYIRRTVALEIQHYEAALDAALARQDSALTVLSARFETIDDLKTAQEARLQQYGNADHVRTARANGVGRVSDEEEIQRLVEEGRLVPLADTAYYRVQEMDYSVPYVTPEMARLLREIGQRVQARLEEAGLPAYRYVISSGLRTADNQQALRAINPNAARGVSSHEFGTTLDIVYHKYDYRHRPGDRLPPTEYPALTARLEKQRRRAYDALGMRYWQELQGILGRVLIELQEEGGVLARLERQQPVFHITVR